MTVEPQGGQPKSRLKPGRLMGGICCPSDFTVRSPSRFVSVSYPFCPQRYGFIQSILSIVFPVSPLPSLSFYNLLLDLLLLLLLLLFLILLMLFLLFCPLCHCSPLAIVKWKHGNSRECEAEPEKQARKIKINLEKARIFWGGFEKKMPGTFFWLVLKKIRNYFMVFKKNCWELFIDSF